MTLINTHDYMPEGLRRLYGERVAPVVPKDIPNIGTPTHDALAKVLSTDSAEENVSITQNPVLSTTLV